MKLVKEKFEVTNNHKLSLPPFLDSSWLGNFDITLIGCSNSPGWINTQRPLGLIRRNRTSCWNSIFAPYVASKPTNLTNNTLND